MTEPTDTVPEPDSLWVQVEASEVELDRETQQRIRAFFDTLDRASGDGGRTYVIA